MEAGGGAAAGAPPGLALLAARQLGALGWPGAAPRGEAGWRAAVAWLEDTKVRGLPEGERGPLRAAAAPGWPAAFADYLARLECPLPGAGAGEGARGGGLPDARLGWLVSHAVMLEFQDRAPEYNAALAARQRRGGRGAGGDAGAAPPGAGGGLAAQLARGAGAPEAARLAGEMAEALGGAGAGGEGGDGGAAGLAGRLEACRKAVKRRQAAAAASAAAASGGGGAVNVESLPLGFAMAAGYGAPALERAAKVLRALYIQDLRDLQTQVDRLVVQAQEYTANPKTDSSLGRTGR